MNQHRVNLQLERLELREIELPLKSPFETSFGRTTRRRILIAKVFDKSGASGYGECVAAEGPFFNPETVETAWLIATKYVAPILARASVNSASQVNDTLSPIRGNRMAKGGVEAAIWDLEAKIANLPSGNILEECEMRSTAGSQLVCRKQPKRWSIR